LRILVIGADADRTAWVEWALLNEDVDLSFAISGDDGIARAASCAFELVILNLALPGLAARGY
jgi:DNA-binding response OmpR family regulator